MSAALRAAADGLLYDVAMCMYVADLLDDDAIGRECPASGWTLHQTLEHLAATYERYAAAFERRLSGQPVFPDGVPAAAPPPSRSGLDDRGALISRLMAARLRLLTSLDRVTPGQERAPITAGLPLLVDVATDWARHGAGHALDFIEGSPALASEPLLMEWAFYPHAGEDDALRSRRMELLGRLRSQPPRKES